jgi:hypothetical protein
VKLGDIARLHGLMRPPCWKKRKWKSEGAARAHLRALLRFPGVHNADRLNVYQCVHCGGWWHVGRR